MDSIEGKASKILMDFIITGTQIKEIIEKNLTIEAYCDELFVFIEPMRKNISYCFNLISNCNNNDFKKEYLLSLDLLSETCYKLEIFLNYSLLYSMNLNVNLANKFDSFTNYLGKSLQQISVTLKIYADILNEKSKKE